MTGNRGRLSFIKHLLLPFMAISLLAVVSRNGPVSGAGPYTLATVARISGTLPASLLATETDANCLARLDNASGSVQIREMCYRGVSFDPSWTPGPPPLLPANHDVLSGAFIEQTGILLVPVFNCTEFLPGLFAASAAIGIQLDKAGGPASGSNVITTDTAAPFNCAAGTGTTTTTGPLTLTPLAQSHNEDSAQSLAVLGHADPCTDYEELGDNARLGGLRDPFNPYDFFDVNGNGSIDVPNDILQVILAYNHGPLDSAPSSAYSPAKDRGAAVGPAGWNRLGPDGHIDVPNDILPVELQYQHSCTAPP